MKPTCRSLCISAWCAPQALAWNSSALASPTWFLLWYWDYAWPTTKTSLNSYKRVRSACFNLASKFALIKIGCNVARFISTNFSRSSLGLSCSYCLGSAWLSQISASSPVKSTKLWGSCLNKSLNPQNIIKGKLFCRRPSNFTKEIMTSSNPPVVGLALFQWP